MKEVMNLIQSILSADRCAGSSAERAGCEYRAKVARLNVLQMLIPHVAVYQDRTRCSGNGKCTPLDTTINAYVVPGARLYFIVALLSS